MAECVDISFPLLFAALSAGCCIGLMAAVLIWSARDEGDE